MLTSRSRNIALPAIAAMALAALTAVSVPALADNTPAPALTVVAPAPADKLDVQLDTSPIEVADSTSKPRIAPPAQVAIREMAWGQVTVSWSAVRGVTQYQLHAYKTDPKSHLVYPFNIVPASEFWTTTTKLTNTFVNNFAPLSDASRLQALPWVITVSAVSPNKNAYKDSSPKAPTVLSKDVIVYNTVEITQDPSADHLAHEKNVVADCAAQGLGAAVATVAGGGVLALAAVWIPGVNAVTWAGVAAGAVAAGAGATLACFVVNKINPNS